MTLGEAADGVSISYEREVGAGVAVASAIATGNGVTGGGVTVGGGVTGGEGADGDGSAHESNAGVALRDGDVVVTGVGTGDAEAMGSAPAGSGCQLGKNSNVSAVSVTCRMSEPSVLATYISLFADWV